MTLFNPHLSPAERYRRTVLTIVASLFGLLSPLAAGMHALSRSTHLFGEASTYEASLFTSMALFSGLVSAAVLFQKGHLRRFEEPALPLPPPPSWVLQHGFTLAMLSVAAGIAVVTLLSFPGLPEAWRLSLVRAMVALAAGTVVAVWAAPWAFAEIPVPAEERR